MKFLKKALAAGTAFLSLLAFNTLPAYSDISPSYELLYSLEDFLVQRSSGTSQDFDINKDGKINVFDLIALKNKILFDEKIEYNGFIKANGRILEDESGQEYIIKGMAFGNNVWANPSTPPENRHHTEESYKELSEMGFNSVRFYINYGLFESDSNPYVYNESGFEWIDKNIEQAKKYGIRLVLNMHYPQGGYQSQGNGMELWTERENQKRLTALWTAIAERYANETGILGYGIVNEPVLPLETTAEDCLAKWQSVAQEITDGIRTADNNHPVFVERMCAVKDMNTGASKWENFNDENNYVKIDDDNIIYEFHYYDPHMYTHQGFSWANTTGYDYTYPDETLSMAVNSKWETSTFNGDKADIENNDWQYLESSVMEIDNENYDMLSLVFQAQNLGEGGIAYADNLKLDEYDENDNFIRTVYLDDFSRTNQFYFWSNDGKGIGGQSSSVGYDDNRSILIYSTTDDANYGKSNFAAVSGHKYVASGYFKVENADKNAIVRPRVDVWSSESAYVLNKEFLEAGLLSNIKFSYDNNVPVYCGEFGAGSNCFTNNRGGEIWVKDVIDICTENSISFNYHTYHEESFGLYQNSPLSPPGNKNEALYDAILNALK